MGCTLEEIRKDSIESAKKEFIGNSTTFQDRGDENIFMPIGKFSLFQLNEIAKKNALRVGKWATKVFGSKFSDNWVFFKETANGLQIKINFPENLENAYKIKLGEIDSIPKKESDEEKSEQLRLEQEERELNIEDLYNQAMNISEKQIEERIKECK